MPDLPQKVTSHCTPCT